MYVRMDATVPSPTMTPQFSNSGTGRFVHPTQDCGLSLREGALLQTFPLSYAFMAPGSTVFFSTHGRQIGNVVPLVLGRVVGRAHLGQARPGHEKPNTARPEEGAHLRHDPNQKAGRLIGLLGGNTAQSSPSVSWAG